MSLAGCQIIPIDLNFYLQKCLEIFDKNSADKIQSKNYKEVNPPCLMPIRVKGFYVKMENSNVEQLLYLHMSELNAISSFLFYALYLWRKINKTKFPISFNLQPQLTCTYIMNSMYSNQMRRYSMLHKLNAMINKVKYA